MSENGMISCPLAVGAADPNRDMKACFTKPKGSS